MFLKSLCLVIAILLPAHSALAVVALGQNARELTESEQSKVDSLFHKILLTPTGSLICTLAQGDSDLMNHLIGTSPEASVLITKDCVSKLSSMTGVYGPLDRKFNEGYRLSMWQRPKKSYLIAQKNAYFPHDSWTTETNQTVIAESVFETEELIYVLAHETQMAFDGKSHLRSHDLRPLNDGWESISHNLFKPNIRKDLLKILDVIADSPLKNIFAVLRSYAFEDAIQRELKSNTQHFNLKIFNENRCNNLVDGLIKQSAINLDPTQMKQLRDAWQETKESHIRMRYLEWGVGEITICQYMAIPKFDYNFFAGAIEGPRPRIRPGMDTGE